MHGSKKLSSRLIPAYSKLQNDKFYQDTIFEALTTCSLMSIQYDSPMPALKTFRDIFLRFKEFYEDGSRGLDSIVRTIEGKNIPTPFEFLNIVDAYTKYVNHINDARNVPFSKQSITLVSKSCLKRVAIYEEMARLAELSCRQDRVNYHDLDLIYGHFLLWINQIIMIKKYEEVIGAQVNITPIGQMMVHFYEKILDILEPHISPESKFIRPYIALSLNSQENLFVKIPELERSAERFDPPILELQHYVESLENFNNELVARAQTLIDEFTLCKGMLNAFSDKLLSDIFSFEKRTTEIRKLMNLFNLFESLSNEALSLLPRIIESKQNWDSSPLERQVVSCISPEPLVDKITISNAADDEAKTTEISALSDLITTLDNLAIEADKISPLDNDISQESSPNHTPIFEQIHASKKSKGSKSSPQENLHPWAQKLANHKETLETIFSNGPIHFRALSHLISALGGTTFSGSKGIKLQIPKAPIVGDLSEKGGLKNSIHPYHDGRRGQPVPQRIVHCMRDFLEQCNLTLPQIWPSEYGSQAASSVSLVKCMEEPTTSKSNQSSKRKHKKHRR